ncbi:cytochrome C oxidase subunit IV family protein [Hydrogenophaga sp. PAMC20947]|uniref:cytochrome C oxidase subunit IV family protein n=1 Tax=Hydrogenophaga sp. PAMC20947 TaxID=2565558 RepID=UPI00109E2F8B|nr:cytochrome C oxidase subunit IV family protein [Hydrogenophaga sp. PAMC20947]QCB46222.1 hypothetical protein E5678_09425 [Hydrogenophaga sp. PAMC20947]
MSIRRINTVAILLALATALSWWLGEAVVTSGGHSLSSGAVLAVLALAAFKGALIALDYMELRTAPALWRRAVLAWMVVMIVLIALVTVGLRA